MSSHNIREVAFYNNALAAVKQSKLLLKQQSIPYKRPPDFLCEMVKSDSHMAKVRIDSSKHSLYTVVVDVVHSCVYVACKVFCLSVQRVNSAVACNSLQAAR
jgi:Eukaryotic rRNA processing protein EBP2